MHYLHIANSDKPVAFYNLDAIISVAYRVKSKRGVEFRRWATGVLRQYVLDGYAANKRRLAQLGQIVQVMDRIPSSLEARDILSVVKAYTGALDLLDDYDHRRIAKPKGRAATYVLDYDECRSLIASMKFSRDSDLFGVEKDDSFRSSIAAIYQGFGGQEMYPTLEEKAANLLYFVVKNHSFHDGNKRIAAALFLYFLNMNDALWADGAKRISDSALVALTIMTAESKPDEKEAMVALAMSFLSLG
ncbi:RhuM family protein [Slackia sp.]